jgi:hypothetical protein
MKFGFLRTVHKCLFTNLFSKIIILVFIVDEETVIKENDVHEPVEKLCASPHSLISKHRQAFT